MDYVLKYTGLSLTICILALGCLAVALDITSTHAHLGLAALFFTLGCCGVYAEYRLLKSELSR